MTGFRAALRALSSRYGLGQRCVTCLRMVAAVREHAVQARNRAAAPRPPNCAADRGSHSLAGTARCGGVAAAMALILWLVWFA